MSQPTPLNPTFTRRKVLAGAAAGLAATTLPGLAFAAESAASGSQSAVCADHSLCVAHHQELSKHLRTILNSSYVDDHMKNKVLATTRCPHCDTGIAPADMDRASFAVLA